MSRIGKKPIAVPKGVTVKIHPAAVEVQGPKGKLTQAFPSGINFELADGQLLAARAAPSRHQDRGSDRCEPARSPPRPLRCAGAEPG